MLTIELDGQHLPDPRHMVNRSTLGKRHGELHFAPTVLTKAMNTERNGSSRVFSTAHAHDVLLVFFFPPSLRAKVRRRENQCGSCSKELFVRVETLRVFASCSIAVLLLLPVVLASAMKDEAEEELIAVKTNNQASS